MQVYDIILILFVSSSNTNRYPHFVLLIVNTLSCGKITTTLELSSTLPNTLIKKKRKKKSTVMASVVVQVLLQIHTMNRERV